MFKDFKQSMLNTFDTIDLGKFRRFLGVKIVQDSEEIFMCEQRYDKEILDRFGMNQSNIVCSIILSENNLSKQDKEDNMDPT